MSIRIEVGLSRDNGDDKTGESIQVSATGEFPRSLLDQPQQLQRLIDELFAKAHAAMALNRSGQAGQPTLARG